MELDELREAALREYRKQRKQVNSTVDNLVGAADKWINAAVFCLFSLTMLPPFLALLKLLSHDVAYLMPDGTKLIVTQPMTMIIGNQTLQQAADYASRAEITHYLAVAGIISGILFGLGIILTLISVVVVTEKRNKFIEQYIYEHSKSK
jgi:hypothetical protein